MKRLAAELIAVAIALAALDASAQQPVPPCKPILVAPPISHEWKPAPLCMPSPFDTADFSKALKRVRSDVVHLNSWYERSETEVAWHQGAASVGQMLALAGASRASELTPEKYFYHAAVLALAGVPKKGNAEPPASATDGGRATASAAQRARVWKSLCSTAKEAYDWMAFAHYCKAPKRNNIPTTQQLQDLERTLGEHCPAAQELRRTDGCNGDWLAQVEGQRSLVKQRAIAAVVAAADPNNQPVKLALENAERSLAQHARILFDRTEKDELKRVALKDRSLEVWRKAETEFTKQATDELLKLKPTETRTPQEETFFNRIEGTSVTPKTPKRVDQLYEITAEKPATLPPSMKERIRLERQLR